MFKENVLKLNKTPHLKWTQYIYSHLSLSVMSIMIYLESFKFEGAY